MTKPKQELETVPLTVRMGPELAQAIRAKAKEERRTINTVVTYALQQYLKIRTEERTP